MQREIRESLENVLSLVSEDLRFAETKNAALLTANAAAVIGILQVNVQGGDLGLVIYLNLLVVVCTISGVVSLISFIPRVVNPYQGMGLEPGPKDNLLFFGHIQKYDPPAYLPAVYSAAGRAGEQAEDLERMYAEQVVVNSRIAARKFTYFRYAIWITIGALVTPPLAYLLNWIIDENNRGRALNLLRRKKPQTPAAVPPPAPPAPPARPAERARRVR